MQTSTSTLTTSKRTHNKELVEKKMQLHKLLNKKRHAKMEVASQDDMEAYRDFHFQQLRAILLIHLDNVCVCEYIYIYIYIYIYLTNKGL